MMLENVLKIIQIRPNNSRATSNCRQFVDSIIIITAKDVYAIVRNVKFQVAYTVM